jgi:YVTN family beta-propeller protein
MGTGLNRKALTAAVALCLALSACGIDPPILEPLTAMANIQLPRDQTLHPALDLLRLDHRSERLYVAHTSNDSLDIIDLKTNRVVGTVLQLRAIKAVALTPDPSIVFASDGGDGTVSVVDVSQLKIIKQIQVGGAPDAIEYDPVHDLVAVSLGKGKQVALIDRQSYKVLGNVNLSGEPELTDIDVKTGLLFIAIHSIDQVQVIDLGARQVVKTYKGCDISAPTGVAYDADLGRLFVANHIDVSVNDTLLDKCLGTVDISRGTDQLAINSHLHHLYAASGGSKNLSVIDAASLKHLGFQGTGPTAVGVASDPSTDRLYVAIGRPGIIGVYHDP